MAKDLTSTGGMPGVKAKAMGEARSGNKVPICWGSDIPFISEMMEKLTLKNNIRHAPIKTKRDVILSIKRSLAQCQQKALQRVRLKSMELHKKSLPDLEKRAIALGYSTENLRSLLEYVRDDAPIVIHLGEYALKSLVNDTHYRSLFETGTSSGCDSKDSRHKWENEMFDGSYARDCEPFDRPKYGCLNILGDTFGVPGAKIYGYMFMTLHSCVRHRTTFANGDTSSTSNQILASNDYYGHVLMRYNDAELRAVLDLMVDRSCREKESAYRFPRYKEVQIHGPICLATDIKSLSVPGKKDDASSGLQNAVDSFEKKTNCNIIWQGDLEVSK